MEEQPGRGINIKKDRDMYTNDKITNGGEITSEGRFSRDGAPFYIFIAPKAENVNSVTTFTVRLVYGEDDTAFPVTAGVWNPAVFSAIQLTGTDIANYRVFWGEEGV